MLLRGASGRNCRLRGEDRASHPAGCLFNLGSFMKKAHAEGGGYAAVVSISPQDTKESCNDVEEVSPALYSPVAQHQPAAIAQHCLASVFNPDLSCLDYRKK